MWGTEHIVTIEGLTLRVVRSGSGPALLLLNGIGASAEMWAPMVARLDGHEVVAVDLPGSGSSPPSLRPMRIRSYARVATGLLDALGYDSIDVLGYSFGGIVAQELARRSPERLNRLVLCATSPGLGGVPPNPAAALLLLSPVRYYNRSAARCIVPLIAGGRTRHDQRSLERHLGERLANPPSPWGYISQLWAVTGWSSLPWLRLVRQPTLILHGDDDPLVPIANARRMAEMIPGASLRVVSGGGHLFLMDEPESIIDDVAGFLALDS